MSLSTLAVQQSSAPRSNCALDALGAGCTSCSRARLRPKAILYRAGERAKFVFLVQSGVLKVSRCLPDGSVRIVRVVRGGDLLGLEALHNNGYLHEVSALSRSEVCALSASRLKQRMSESGQLSGVIVEQFQRSLDSADTWLADFSIGPARKRVARALLHFSRFPGRDGTCMNLSRRDLAAILGLTTETVSRLMAELARQGLVRQRGQDWISVNSSGLRELLDEPTAATGAGGLQPLPSVCPSVVTVGFDKGSGRGGSPGGGGLGRDCSTFELRQVPQDMHDTRTPEPERLKERSG